MDRREQEDRTEAWVRKEKSSASRALGQGELPRQIARFTIERLLGAGGFGVVYLARDEQLQRLVAVKVPHPKVLIDTGAAEYLAEARLMARLDHPHIVPVHDVGSTEQYPCYIVSKYIDGENLAGRLRHARMSYRETAELLAVIADALHFAHTRDVVHRDVKPSNILIDRGGRSYLADFGLALSVEDPDRFARVVGTPAYTSPEQARGEGHRVDGRSDIFSLGAVLYLMLVGRPPFRGDDSQVVLDKVIRQEPRPPRQQDDRIPKELERICLKCLSKRAADRYTTARDLADDLQHYLDSAAAAPAPFEEDARSEDASQTASGVLSGRSFEQPVSTLVPVMPKGLRTFEAMDAEFFLQLLPGPHDRDGLPESIRFWKSRVEPVDAGDAFSVGLIYGPSGCGKSSLVKAGLLPRLSDEVTSIYVEATAAHTEQNLWDAVRRAAPQLEAGWDLPQSVAALRRGTASVAGKLLIVLDQFEQWLDQNSADESQPLVRALRQCDGERIQCLLLVRDDYWMSATRLMRAIEIPVEEGCNCAAVDLFSVRHTRKVLAMFGQAYGALSSDATQMTRSQRRFLAQAAEGLAEEGKVVCVRLALFAEMFKDKPWEPGVLKGVGGAEGVGVEFLEDTFGSASAPPEHKLHEPAARATLAALLPEHGSDIKGRVRSEEELLAASGYARKPDQFQQLLRILDHQLRLITRTESADDESTGEPGTEGGRATAYQLTHDYLIGSLRQWLTRKQRETRQGRAELRLEELSADWQAQRIPQHLPTLWEWLAIRVWTRAATWSRAQQRLMRAAGGYYAVRTVIVVVFIAAILYAGRVLNRRMAANHLVTQLMQADFRGLPDVIEQVRADGGPATDRLCDMLETPQLDKDQRLRAGLAVLDQRTDQVPFLQQEALRADPEQLLVICRLLQTAEQQRAASLWEAAVVRRAPTHQRLAAAGMLAQFDPGNEQWSRIVPRTASLLVQQHPLRIRDWIPLFLPVRQLLADHAEGVFRDPGRPATERLTAAILLAEFATDDVETLCELTVDAVPAQFAPLLPSLKKTPTRATAALLKHVDEQPQPDMWPERERPVLSGECERLLNEAQGFAAAEFALCQSLPHERFATLCGELQPVGYRPARFRPYRAEGQLLVAAIWRRDGRQWQTVIGKSPQEILEADREMRQRGLLAFDLAWYEAEAGGRGEFAGLWVEPGTPREIVDSAMYVSISPGEHAEHWQPLNDRGFVPRANVLTLDDTGEIRHSSVRWKLAQSLGYKDSWESGADELSRHQHESWCQVEIRCGPRDTFSAVWWTGFAYGSRMLDCMSPTDHLEQCRRWSDEGRRPESITVAAHPPDGAATAGSVWLQPIVPEAARDRVAGRQANAVIALMRLGHAEPLEELFRDAAAERVVAHVIDRVRAFGVEPGEWVRLLEIEKNAELRRRCLLALATYDPATVDAAGDVRKLVSDLFREHPDPGIHGAADLVLRRWKVAATVERKEMSPRPPTDRWWFTDAQGHVLVVIPGPNDFDQGSPGTEPGRDHFREWQHRRRIPRTFAIAAHEVTVDQFLAYQADFGYSIDYSPTRRCPVNSVTWFDAARYCRWLSEQEGIPESQMCFPPLEEIQPGMQLPDDMLQRTGYRLPTESEWEFACRAGTVTARYYGYAPELLRDYAWTTENSQYRSAPVGQLIPNRWGLFDMLGNAMEWCHDEMRWYANRDGEEPLIDQPSLSGQTLRATRGGAFLYQPLDARSAHRDDHTAVTHRPYLGFRVARTMLP